MTQEVWKDIEDYEGFYQVSNLGSVKSLDREVRRGRSGVAILEGRVLKGDTTYLGYEAVTLQKDGKRKRAFVHRLVAIAFVDNPEPLKFDVVNHKDETTTNNREDNLEWCTQEYNTNYGSRNAKMAIGHWKPIIATHPSTKEEIFFSSINEAISHGFSRTGIWKACKGATKMYKGYIWRYANNTTKGEETA